MEIAVLACGCFWGPEKKFGSLNGVYKTEVGYCGGKTEKTTYQEVCSGNTNHAEVVKINFDPKIISYEEILNFFFKIPYATTNNSIPLFFVIAPIFDNTKLSSFILYLFLISFSLLILFKLKISRSTP